MNSEKGAAIYSPAVLRIYDTLVVAFSNRYAWRCPADVHVAFYESHLGAAHLDVGVGTGYYLDQSRFPTAAPRLTLLDLNPNSLSVTAARLQRYAPRPIVADVLEPLPLGAAQFDSIGLGYLLHCLPGAMADKGVALAHLRPLLREGGTLFGTTILGRGVRHNPLSRALMALYNRKGIFSNRRDDLPTLQAALGAHFRDVSTRVVGCVALFSATHSR